MPSFNENPTEFADLNDAFPDLSAQTGLSFEQVRAIGENTYFNKNQNESKASMVANATSGNLAGLDASGNLTDSGVAPSDLQEKMQYSTMPTASASNVGAIVQYIGDTDSTYTNGYFYKCVESGGTYGWEEVISGGGGGDVPANMVTTNTSQEITGGKTFLTNVKISTQRGVDNTLISPIQVSLSNVLGVNASSPYYYMIGSYNPHQFTGLGLTAFGMFNTESYAFRVDEVVSGVGFIPNSARNDWGFYRKNPANAMKQVVSFNKITMFGTGDNIITRVTNSELIDNQVIVCIANSTDANVTYQAKHTYKFNYANSTWTATDITPSGSAPTILTNTTASTWVADNTYAGYGYKCELSVSGVTANDLSEVIFGVAEATSGNYAPVAETGAGTITIYSKVNTSITIPTIKVDKL